MRIFLLLLSVALFLASCSISKKLERSARENVLSSEALQTAHVGISVFEPATGKYWYNYQGDKYFVPASNTKLPTCYAAMKYLGDSLVGLRYGISNTSNGKNEVTVLQGTADPTFLHKDFKSQLVLDFLQKRSAGNEGIFALLVTKPEFKALGNGWSWNDYQAAYMAERSAFPIFGNTIHIRLNDVSNRFVRDYKFPAVVRNRVFTTGIKYFDSLLQGDAYFLDSTLIKRTTPNLTIERHISSNFFFISEGTSAYVDKEMPFTTDAFQTLLTDTLKKEVFWCVCKEGKAKCTVYTDDDIISFYLNKWNTIHSQPTDSLLRPMMHRSDNFFAEQSLLMVSNEHLGFMNDEKIIDTLLKTDFKDLPQKPRWADGSGLSRYNLFTPQDFVFILNKMKSEFGMARVKDILPTGGEGTLSSYYKKDSTFIYAKTGTLSGVVALSGFLYTKKGKELIFSVLVNNHQGSATAVRRAVEKFVQGLREKY